MSDLDPKLVEAVERSLKAAPGTVECPHPLGGPAVRAGHLCGRCTAARILKALAEVAHDATPRLAGEDAAFHVGWRMLALRLESAARYAENSHE